jgi:putative SOS response-associated peptidase YedK
MFINYTAEVYEIQDTLPVCYRFLTEERYNRGMCGRYGFSVKNAKDVSERFNTYNELADYKPRWNILPGQQNPVITKHSPNYISRMVWGLIPSWAKYDSFRFNTINARVEGIESKSVYRKPFRTQRCLVPATGFYEPDKIHYSKPPFPWHYFQLKEQPLFGFAGIYDIWKDKQTGKEIYSYTIITTTPNALVGKIHDRMPVILQKEDEETWLNPDITEPEHLLPLLQPYPADQMEEWQVGDAARNPRNDSPEVIKPVRSNRLL